MMAVMAAKGVALPASTVAMNIDMTGGGGSTNPGKPKPAQSKAPRDVHGGAEFIVKVQVPMTGTPGMCRFYDRTRKIDGYFDDALKPSLRAIGDMVRHSSDFGGMKAFCFACREGANLRIFHDKTAPPQAW